MLLLVALTVSSAACVNIRTVIPTLWAGVESVASWTKGLRDATSGTNTAVAAPDRGARFGCSLDSISGEVLRCGKHAGG